MKLDKLNYVDEAERVIKSLSKNQRTGAIELTTSKIRNLLAMTSDIYNEVIHDNQEYLSEEILGRVQYLRLRVVYESGQDNDKKINAVKDFVEKADIVSLINGIGKSRGKLLLFCNYMEALTAYHKYYGGRDN